MYKPTYKNFRVTGRSKRFKVNQKWFIGVSVAVLLLAGFYWFSYRPSQIRKDCRKVALKASAGAYDTIETPYTEQTLGYYQHPSRLETKYETQYIDKSAETYSAVYSACTSQKGI